MMSKFRFYAIALVVSHFLLVAPALADTRCYHGMLEIVGTISTKDVAPVRECLASKEFNRAYEYVEIDSEGGDVSDIPTNVYAQHMVFSVAALLQAIVGGSDELSIGTLNNALKYMNTSYKSGVSYSDIQNLIKVPNEAYFTNELPRSKLRGI